LHRGASCINCGTAGHQALSLLSCVRQGGFRIGNGAANVGERTQGRVRHDGGERPDLAEWIRPICANERSVPMKLPTFRSARPCRQTAVTLNRSQRSSTCRALSSSAFSLRSPRSA
jgi:hypothetical protein